ncbi:MAG: hypothetical protein OER88_02725 [Planctomycetota bacterium]|nr:hypothetical protein [Planctomycetota bacterium]
MRADPIRVIALCSCILGVFFLAKSISIKSPKYVLHELLSFKVNKSRFFRKYINQKLDAITGFLFLFVGFGLMIYLEVEALREQERDATRLTNWYAVIGGTIGITLAIAVILNKTTRYFSNKIFVEHVAFMVRRHGYPLESDEALVLELGRVMRIARNDDDTIESYGEKVRARMGLEPPDARSGRRPF